jgi:hypothetical protein
VLKCIQDLIFTHKIAKLNPEPGLDRPNFMPRSMTVRWCRFGTQIADLMCIRDLLMAASVLTMLPILILTLFFQRQLITAMTRPAAL